MEWSTAMFAEGMLRAEALGKVWHRSYSLEVWCNRSA